MGKKAQFGSRLGLIAATVGSAVGLGNIWRFPAEAQANGGAAFLLLYICCVALLGIPVMVGEFALGRGTRLDIIGAFAKLQQQGSKKKATWWKWAGVLGVVASFFILSFYMVVAAWTLEYFVQSLTGGLYAGGSGDARFGLRMHEYINGSWRPLIFTGLIFLINWGVLAKGVNKGIERMSNMLMPALFLLLVALVVVAMTLSGAGAGLAYFFKPDFSVITGDTVLNALGQAFFSLSLGVGILATYAGYFPRSEHLGRTATTVSCLDLLVALLMGMITFPAVMTFGLMEGELSGTSLVFVTLPEVFARMPLTQLWSSLFFLLLLVAALTSTVSLAEVSVAFTERRFGLKRAWASALSLLLLAPFSAMCSLSQGVLSDFHILGMDVFTLFDTVATNYMLPLVALATCLALGWGRPAFLRRELAPGGGRPAWARFIQFMLRWVCPLLITIILVKAFY